MIEPTPLQRMVLRLLVEGMPLPLIARETGITPRKLRQCLYSLQTALGCTTREMLVAVAVDRRWCQPVKYFLF